MVDHRALVQTRSRAIEGEDRARSNIAGLQQNRDWTGRPDERVGDHDSACDAFGTTYRESVCEVLHLFAAAQARVAMLLYYMTTDHWGITALRDRRLKLSRINELNDPFELQAVRTDESAMPAWRQLYKTSNETKGLLCFSTNWRSPVMWAHYADKHKGMCLGFDIPAQDRLFKMQYENDFLLVAFDPRDDKFGLTIDVVKKFFSHKFVEWEYEQEWRAMYDLSERDKLSGLYFADFDEHMVLKEIILGERNSHEPGDFEELLSMQGQAIRICKAQANNLSFEMREVPNSGRTYNDGE